MNITPSDSSSTLAYYDQKYDKTSVTSGSSSARSSSITSSSSLSSSSSSSESSSPLKPWDSPEVFKHNYKSYNVCSGKEDKNRLIQKIAEDISKIYAAFLTKEQGHEYTADLIFIGVPQKFPDLLTVKVFQLYLEAGLISKMAKADDSITTLHTDYLPQGVLKKALENTGITGDEENFDNYRLYFPRDSQLTIHIDGNKIQTRMLSGKWGV